MDHARVGISVGKKLGNAVCRNKVKRQLRSIVDDVFTIEEGYDVIIIVRPAYTNKSFEENKIIVNKIIITYAYFSVFYMLFVLNDT